MQSSKSIKWGIIGCGNIANTFCEDLALTKGAELTAVASRSIEKARLFAEKHNAKKAFGSYEHLLKDSEVDIVYIATPHVSHAELSIKAMQNGKHVLCEKPLALNYKQAWEIIRVSKETNLFFMEALWTRFNPNIIAIKELIDKGIIGEITYINADFSFKSDKSIDSRVLALELGGGAILDIGIYPAFLSYLFLGTPKSILAKSLLHPKTGCDLQTSMIFEYQKAQALLFCGFTINSDMIAKIYGTEGAIYLHKTWHMTEGFTIVKNNQEQVIQNKTIGHAYVYEIQECMRCLEDKQIESILWSHQNSLDLISMLDKVRKDVSLVYPQEK